MPYTTRQLAALKRWRRSATLTPFVRDVLEGLVASDGHLSMRVEQAAFTLVGAEVEWVEHVQNLLEQVGITVHRSVSRQGHACLRTWAYQELGQLHRRWYPERKKVIPLDVRVNPTSLLYWYLGDGTLKERDGHYGVELGTYAFLPSDVVRLARALQAVLPPWTVRVYYVKAGPALSIAHAGVPAFLRFIGPSPVACYAYKWETPGYRVRKALGDLTRLSPVELAALDNRWRTRRSTEDQSRG